MAGYPTISRVSRALQGLLTDALTVVDPGNPPIAQLSNLKPPPGGQPPVLTLFLYEITEDATVRNRGHRRILETDQQGQPRYRMVKPGMPLVLRYLVTPWANDRTTEHLMIGRTLQVLYERQIHRGADLSPELDLESLSITLAPLGLEERTRVWWSIQEPYRLSLNYEARVVDLDVTAGEGEELPPVREREFAGTMPDGPP
ncbi:MAG: hypothetical protein AUI14_21455 [Actinobacteria bacterium 13_2_20CM_2_71_6]|nr:MAG: hypothetical protein AUI14_21455 [Actinobacteria bacterium 13_2_20CM_2_71_6]